MNILFVSSKVGWGGIMSWMVQTARGLTKQNHNIWIISNPKSKLNKKNYPDLNIIEKSLGANYSPLTILYLITFIKKNKVDIVVSNIKKEIIAAGIAAKLSKIPNIRRIGLHVDLNKKTKKYHKHLITHSIIPAKYIFNKAKDYNSWLDEKDFSVVYNGRNTVTISNEKREKIRSEWKIKRNDFVFGITVKLSVTKNISGVINSFYELAKKYDNIKLVISGEGSEKNKLFNLTSKLNIEEKVIFTGFTNTPQLFAACYDVAILNSIEEGFPNSLVEYMSAGTPVITTNVGGVNEIAVNKQNAIVIESDNNIELVKAMELLFLDSELRKRIGVEGKKTVEEKFNYDKMIAEVEQTFKRVISARLH